MSDTKDFVWTEEKVKEFVRWNFNRTDHDYLPHAIEQFKASHSRVEEKGCGWEIVEFKHGESILSLRNGKYRNHLCSISDIKWLLSFCVIHSVKRLSDGEVFTVGDEVSNGYISGNIRLFTIITEKNRDSEVSASISSRNNVGKIAVSISKDIPNNLLENLQKAPKRQPLFKDYLGNDVFKGDIVYWVGKQTFQSGRGNPDIVQTGHFNDYVYFKNKADADEYILLNKECLSLNDLLSAWNGVDHTKEIYKQSRLYQNFEQLAKNKLKERLK